MGSQSVTNFSEIRMNRIQNLVKDYSPKSSKAATQVREIGAAAITLGTPSRNVPAPTKGKKGMRGAGVGGAAATPSQPANEFLQALSSRSVETAVGLILGLARELKKPEQAYEKYEIETDARPVESFSNLLATAYETMMSKSQEKTDASFAVKEAIPKTIIDVVSRVFPREKEPADVDGKKFARAFSTIERDEIVTAFLENVASSLINQVLEATKGSLPHRRVDEVKQKIRERFIPEFIKELRGKK